MQLVANLGFPAIVTMYLLVRIEGKLESLSIGINSLNNRICSSVTKVPFVWTLITVFLYLFTILKGGI